MLLQLKPKVKLEHFADESQPKKEQTTTPIIQQILTCENQTKKKIEETDKIGCHLTNKRMAFIYNNCCGIAYIIS